MGEASESAGRVSMQVSTDEVRCSGRREDHREVYRITIDVLATPEQVWPLVALLETAVCGQPDDHQGPCRVAWRISASGPDQDVPVPPADRDRIRRALSALEVLPQQQATAELLIEAGYAAAPTVDQDAPDATRPLRPAPAPSRGPS